MKRTIAAGVVCLVLTGALLGGVVAQRVRDRAPANEMARAAQRFVNGLSPERRGKAVLAFDGKERRDWRFVPGDRHGLMMAEMADADRVAARDLLRTALSSRGMLKVEAVMALETVLRELENNNQSRDPAQYAVAIFGTPGAAAWGWHFEGHHLSLNFTCRDDKVISVTPYFLGSNPAEVRSGRRAGERILAQEEDLARRLMEQLSGEQLKAAIVAETAPADVLTVPGRPIDGVWPEPPLGVAVSTFTTAQRETFEELLGEYVHALRGPLAEAEMARINEAGIEKVRFCWAGSRAKGKGHYYRIVGPTFAIEYDNTQNEANHIHTVWHDRTRDFGGDPLAEHVNEGHR